MNETTQMLDQIQSKCFEMGYWEDLRHYYKPNKIKLLIIAEDIPNGQKRFFYYDKVKKHDYLFMDTMEAIFPEKMKSYRYKSDDKVKVKREMLNKFYEREYYLINYYKYPKDMIKGLDSICMSEFIDEFNSLNLDSDCKIIILNSVSFVKSIINTKDSNVFITPYKGGDKNEQYKLKIKEVISDFKNEETANAKP